MLSFIKRFKLGQSFTITELSVVIAVTGILLSGAIGGIQSTSENAKIKQDNLEINQIAQAIDAFFVKNKYIPCPANPTLLESNGNYGIGDLTLGKRGYGFNNNEDPEVGFIFGTIPVKDLGLDLSLIYDKWNHKRTYLVYAPLCIPIGNNIGTTTAIKDGYEVLKTDTPSQITSKKLSTIKNYYSVLGKIGNGTNAVKKYFIPVNAKISSSTGNTLFDSENNIGYLIIRHGSKIENCAWKRDGTRESESSTFSLLTTGDNAPSEPKNCFRNWLGNNVNSSTGLPSANQYIKDSGVYGFSNSSNASDKPLNFISDKGMNFFLGTIDKLMVNSQKVAEFSNNQNTGGNYITDDGAVPMKEILVGPTPVRWNVAARDFVQKGFVNMFDIIGAMNPISTSSDLIKIYKDNSIMIEAESQSDQSKKIIIVNHLNNIYPTKNFKYKAIIYDPDKFNADGNVTIDTTGFFSSSNPAENTSNFFFYAKNNVMHHLHLSEVLIVQNLITTQNVFSSQINIL